MKAKILKLIAKYDAEPMAPEWLAFQIQELYKTETDDNDMWPESGKVGTFPNINKTLETAE